MKLLHVDSSILGDNSVSRKISAGIVEALKAEHPGIEVTRRDLGAEPIGHLTGAYLAGQNADVKHDQALQEDLDLGGRTLAEFLAADIVVLGVPMYNFAVPSQLKAWVDRVLVAGKTFRYTASGPEGLAGGKRVILAVSRGGQYLEGAAAAMEHQESWLKVVFGFMGITDVEVIRAEGVARGPEMREAALKAALGEAGALRAA
ncbi:MAG: FMN-dependent NADH-azoreductase [Caulobacteraceae bacterium]|nr:FMN-dependent NADH-azoreductase [Caulobacter sp.]